MPKSRKKNNRRQHAEPRQQHAHPGHAHAHTHQPQITSVPARIIEQDRKTSHTMIAALAKTALALSDGENAAEKMGLLKDLWAMQKEAEDRQAEREFNTAKVVVAMELPKIPKTGLREFTDKKNQVQSSEYSTLDDIEGVLDPLCRAHGLVKEYSSKTNDKGWACQVLTVRHVGGYKEVFESPYMPLDTSGSKNNQQGAGSVAKYGRRYALIGAFNIYHVDVDNDGGTPKTDEVKDDPITKRVMEEANKNGGTPKGPATLTLPEAAEKLESKLRNLPLDKRAEALIKHIGVIEAMEKDETLKAKADELRKLCEEVTHAAG